MPWNFFLPRKERIQIPLSYLHVNMLIIELLTHKPIVVFRDESFCKGRFQPDVSGLELLVVNEPHVCRFIGNGSWNNFRWTVQISGYKIKVVHKLKCFPLWGARHPHLETSSHSLQSACVWWRKCIRELCGFSLISFSFSWASWLLCILEVTCETCFGSGSWFMLSLTVIVLPFTLA